MRNYYAHSREGRPPEEWHNLKDHLESVAEKASAFAADFNAADWAYLSGLWHDLGKYSREFQNMLFAANGVDAHIEKPGRGGTMGKKHIVPYALYRTEGYISAHLAQQTGFGEDDLKLLWDALINMFDHDHSAARGKMNARRLIVFKHESMLGNAPAHKLFDCVNVKRITDASKPARSFEDYKVQVEVDKIPSGVRLLEEAFATV